MDTRYDPLPTLLQYVEGKSWVVEYYQQRVGDSDELSPLQTNISAPFQQFHHIRQLELKVTTALQISQNEQTKQMEVTGAATVYPFMIPNTGDMFLADIGDGREGVFTIVTSEKKTHLKEAYYAITYLLKGYSDTLGNTLSDLRDKTVETSVFRRDYVLWGQNPLLLEDDYNFLLEFEKIRHELIEAYCFENFSVETQTLNVPDQEYRTYDPFLTQFVVTLLTADDHPYIGRIRRPTVDGQLVTRYPTLWDALMEMNERMLPTVMQRVRLLDTVWFKSQALYAGVYYNGIKRVVFPFDARIDVDADYAYSDCPSLVNSVLLKAGKPRYTALARIIGDMEWEGLTYQQLQGEEPAVGPEVLPVIVPVTADDYYVLSERFYRERKPSSQLEYLVLRFLRGQETDKPMLMNLAQKSTSWKNVERFYYQPLIIALLTATMRRN